MSTPSGESKYIQLAEAAIADDLRKGVVPAPVEAICHFLP